MTRINTNYKTHKLNSAACCLSFVIIRVIRGQVSPK